MAELSFAREPAVYLEVLKQALAAVAVFAIPDLTPEAQALILAGVYAVVGAAQALKTRPVAPAAFVAVLTAGAALAAYYGLDFGPEKIAIATALIGAVFALQTRAQVSPA